MAKLNTGNFLIVLKILLMLLSKTGGECPLGFEPLSYNTVDYCVKIKLNETFFDKYKNCAGNEILINFFSVGGFYNFTRNKDIDQRFWIDYVRAYEDGPFINWRIGDLNMGGPIAAAMPWANNTYPDGMCAIWDMSDLKFNVVRCEETYNRFCMVRSYESAQPIDWGCPAGYMQFSVPTPSCLYAHSPARKGSLRATWPQVEDICRKYDGHILQKGYIYLNHAELAEYVLNHEIPLGIRRNLHYIEWAEGEDKLDLPQDMYLSYEDFHDYNKSFGSTFNSNWSLREPSHIYNCAICESFINLPKLHINLEYRDSRLLFQTNLNSDISRSEPYVWCFTDSVTYYPVKADYVHSFEAFFDINYKGDGYYWCLVTNMLEFLSETSEKVLFLKAPNVENLYSITIYNKSLLSTTENNRKKVEEELNVFFQNLPNLYLLPKPLLKLNVKVKRKLSGGDLLVHVELPHGKLNKSTVFGLEHRNTTLSSFDFRFMRHVLKCSCQIDSRNDDCEGYDIGTRFQRDNCSMFICTGDYNVGAYWIVEENINCEYTTPSITISTEDDITTTTEICTTTTMKIGSQVSELVDNLHNLANGSVNATQLTVVTSQINDILDFGQDVEIPKSVLQDLEKIIKKVELKENETQLKIVEKNIAIAVAERGGPIPIVGIRVNAIVENFDDNSLDILSEDDMNESISNSKDSEIIVNIPKDIGTGTDARLSFVAFKNDNAFNNNASKEVQRVNSRVLSISLGNITRFENQHIDIYLKPYEGILLSNETKRCAFWNFSLGANGEWSTEGCEFIKNEEPNGLDICRCNHLTHFAELITSDGEDIGDLHRFVLTVISYIGCVLSLLGLFVIGLTGVLFKSWRSDFNNKIWLHLSASTAIMMIAFLMIALIDFSTFTGLCIFSGIALHYSLLASFCWMLVSAVLSYKRLVTVFSKSTSHRLLKACAFGWAAPLCPIILLFIIDPDNYVEKLNFGISKSFCYPTGLGFWLTVFTPVALIVVANSILFFVIIYSVFMSRKIQRHGDSKQLLRSLTVSFLLFFLFGLTWGFVLLSEHIVMKYLFCITATLQGLVLFVFFIVGNKKTRDLWCMRLHLKERGKVPVTSSTMSRSISKGKPSSNKTIPLQNVSYKSTKPRSMSGNLETSDSRFS